jgi:DNA-directed RNA polymerase subunit RPC12/RpoP
MNKPLTDESFFGYCLCGVVGMLLPISVPYGIYRLFLNFRWARKHSRLTEVWLAACLLTITCGLFISDIMYLALSPDGAQIRSLSTISNFGPGLALALDWIAFVYVIFVCGWPLAVLLMLFFWLIGHLWVGAPSPGDYGGVTVVMCHFGVLLFCLTFNNFNRLGQTVFNLLVPALFNYWVPALLIGVAAGTAMCLFELPAHLEARRQHTEMKAKRARETEEREAEWERTRPERERAWAEARERKAAQEAAQKAKEETERQEWRFRAAQSAPWGTGIYCEYCGSDNIIIGETDRCAYLNIEYSSFSNCNGCRLGSCTSTHYVCSICGKSWETNRGIY